MTKKSPSSGDSHKEFLLNLHRDSMQKIEDENPEGYKEDLLWKASKELLMQFDDEEILDNKENPITKELLEPDSESESYDEYSVTFFNNLQKPEQVLDGAQKEKKPPKLEETENGSFVNYYENGEILSKGTYLNGKLNGEYFRFFENGQLMNRKTYANGITDGPYEWYYENGQLREKGAFKDGKGRDGEVVMFHRAGQLRFRRVYKNGKRIR